MAIVCNKTVQCDRDLCYNRNACKEITFIR